MNPVIALSLGRVAVGAVAVADPERAARVFQLDPESNPQLGYVTRLFGIREVALGLATLMSSGRTRTGMVGLGILVDAADGATSYLAMQDGAVSRKTAMALMGPAAGAVASGLVALVRR
jgi:hypothetical protein